MDRKREQYKGIEATASVKESWTVDIPFQHVFVKAEPHRIELDPEMAMGFIEEELDSLCRVELCEVVEGDALVMRAANAWRLLASCPFCEEGQDQVLASGNWVRIHDWRFEEFDATAQSEDEYIKEHRTEIYLATSLATPGEALLEAFFREAIEEWGEAGDFSEMPETHVYGLDLEKMLEDTDGQLRLPMSDAAFKHIAYGIEGYFGGLYRCPHCGGIFAAVFRDGRQTHRLGKYQLLSDCSEGIDELIAAGERQRRSALSSSNPYGLLPTMAAHVERSGELVSLNANIGGRQHRLEFNTKIGNFLIDESTCFRRGRWDNDELINNPLTWSGIFGSHELVNLLREQLPELSSDIGLYHGTRRSLLNLRLLIIANRFVGYPNAFYEEIIDLDLIYRCYPVDSGFPRDYTDMPKLYEMTGLPAKKSLKRLLYAKPMLLRALVGLTNLPFKNVDVLRRFFELPNALELLKLLNIERRSCGTWRWLATVKGEGFVFDYLTRSERMAIYDMSTLLGDAADDLRDLAREHIEDMPMEQIARVLTCQKWQRKHPRVDLDKPYNYDDFACGLEFDEGKFAFELPGCPRDFVLASVELRNCLHAYATQATKPGEPVVMLMRQEQKLVAALSVQHDGRVITALGKCNKTIRMGSDLHAALVAWVEQKSLHFAAEVEAGIDDF